MNYNFLVSSYFKKEAKKLAKKYHSFAQDLMLLKESLQDNPLQGVELYPGIRKIRMSIKSKGKGKSGSARVITYNVLVSEQEGIVVLLLLYDKSESSTVKLDVVKEIINDEFDDILNSIK